MFADADGPGGNEQLPAGGPAAFGIWDLVRMVLVLLLVVGAVYGLVLLLRQRGNRSSDAEADSPIRVLATRNLGGNRDVHVVMIGSEVMVLGGGDNGVQLLRTIDDRETIDELVLAHSSSLVSGERAGGFAAALGRWLGTLGVRGQTEPDEEDETPTLSSSGSFLSSQQSRLRQMR